MTVRAGRKHPDSGLRMQVDSGRGLATVKGVKSRMAGGHRPGGYRSSESSNRPESTAGPVAGFWQHQPIIRPYFRLMYHRYSKSPTKLSRTSTTVRLTARRVLSELPGSDSGAPVLESTGFREDEELLGPVDEEEMSEFDDKLEPEDEEELEDKEEAPEFDQELELDEKLKFEEELELDEEELLELEELDRQLPGHWLNPTPAAGT